MNLLAGVDIGGTKCAISLGRARGDSVEIIDKRSFPTVQDPEQVIDQLLQALEDLLLEHSLSSPDAIGISCGGPLDSKMGLILSPPNLPRWDRIDVVGPFQRKFHAPVGLQNDANACALAEWKWGAGKGTRNMIFLTFGTGMGAGLILDQRLYSGTNDMAGEVGHMRMEKDGPIGFGKAGSFEGFCSGGGIAQLAQGMVKNHLELGKPVSFCRSPEDLRNITARMVGEAAQQGDPLALDIYTIVGRKLGDGLAVLVDLLNPECIVIGSIYGRQQSILEPIVLEQLRQEAVPLSLSVCRIVPAGLQENVGDYASLSVALHTLQM